MIVCQLTIRGPPGAVPRLVLALRLPPRRKPFRNLTVSAPYRLMCWKMVRKRRQDRAGRPWGSVPASGMPARARTPPRPQRRRSQPRFAAAGKLADAVDATAGPARHASSARGWHRATPRCGCPGSTGWWLPTSRRRVSPGPAGRSATGFWSRAAYDAGCERNAHTQVPAMMPSMAAGSTMRPYSVITGLAYASTPIVPSTMVCTGGQGYATADCW
jgi:hypothetical protein